MSGRGAPDLCMTCEEAGFLIGPNLVADLITDCMPSLSQSGTVPACVTSALVTPIHKKGNDLDSAIYRPIAVGEPLYRMYTNILKKRLIDWSEEHGIGSPAQAGFRPAFDGSSSFCSAEFH